MSQTNRSSLTVFPQKKLGQNFLVDANICRKIIEHCDLFDSDEILEIGPGLGVLTRHIIPAVKRIWAVETDPKLVSHLNKEFAATEKLKVIHKDILKFDFSELTQTPLKVIGNLPYSISSKIVEKLLLQSASISRIFMTVQWEFAQRLKAAVGSKD